MDAGDHDLSTDAILAILEAVHAHEEPPPDEGLRERKKRRLRQRISNVATAMFLAEGFDNVSVARIAAACEVSEQTVFNYFPTKESMFFDRNESAAGAIADAVRDRGRSLTEVVTSALSAGLPRDLWEGLDEGYVLRLFRLFCEVAEGSPTLRAAPYLELGSFSATVGAALAERIGADPADPEVRFTAVVIGGLAHVRIQAVFTHVRGASSIAALESAVLADVERALRLAAPTLDAFDSPTDPIEPG